MYPRHICILIFQKLTYNHILSYLLPASVSVCFIDVCLTMKFLANESGKRKVYLVCIQELTILLSIFLPCYLTKSHSLFIPSSHTTTPYRLQPQVSYKMTQKYRSSLIPFLLAAQIQVKTVSHIAIIHSNFLETVVAFELRPCQQGKRSSVNGR